MPEKIGRRRVKKWVVGAFPKWTFSEAGQVIEIPQRIVGRKVENNGLFIAKCSLWTPMFKVGKSVEIKPKMQSVKKR
jgi:hypothetical protein